MRLQIGTSFFMLTAALAGAQTSPGSDPQATSPEALRAQIEALREPDIVWRKVHWRTCLIEALAESARDKKPVFLWVLGGSPDNGRC